MGDPRRTRLAVSDDVPVTIRINLFNMHFQPLELCIDLTSLEFDRAIVLCQNLGGSLLFLLLEMVRLAQLQV